MVIQAHGSDRHGVEILYYANRRPYDGGTLGEALNIVHATHHLGLSALELNDHVQPSLSRSQA